MMKRCKDDFEELKKQCRAVAGDDEKYFVKLVEEKVVDQLASLFIHRPSKVDQCPNLQDLIGVNIPKKKRGSNAPHITQKPEEQDTKTDAPSTSNLNLQLSQSVFENSRKDVNDRDDDDDEDDYVPADCKEKGKKVMEYETTKKEKGKRQVIGSEHGERKVKQKRSIPKKVDLRRLGLEPPPPLSQELKNFIERKGGTDVKLVVMKNLYKTDLDKRHDRLSIPVSQIRDPTFLSEEEKNSLIKPDTNNGVNQSEEEKNPLIKTDANIGVNVVISDGLQVVETTRMKLRYWDTNSQYALTSSWVGVVGRNRDMLSVNSIVQVWSFRVNGELWLIVVKIRNADVDDDVAVMSKEGKGDGDDNQRTENGGSTALRLFGVSF